MGFTRYPLSVAWRCFGERGRGSSVNLLQLVETQRAEKPKCEPQSEGVKHVDNASSKTTKKNTRRPRIPIVLHRLPLSSCREHSPTHNPSTPLRRLFSAFLSSQLTASRVGTLPVMIFVLPHPTYRNHPVFLIISSRFRLFAPTPSRDDTYMLAGCSSSLNVRHMGSKVF